MSAEGEEDGMGQAISKSRESKKKKKKNGNFVQFCPCVC